MNRAFEKCRLGNEVYENHIVRSATYWPLGNPDGTVSEAQIALGRELAENHVGLIITGMVTVSEEGRYSAIQNRLYDDRFIEGHKKLTDAVRQAGGKIVCQINHCGAASDCGRRLSPSGIPYPQTRNAPAVEMSADDVKRITGEFANAAVRAKESGYDGVQIHCAHGYLLSQFINPLFNKRTDEYGVDGTGRFRFAKEVLEAVIAAVGEDYQVSVKINSNIEENDEAYLPDFLMMCKEMKKLGVAFAEISGCNFTPLGRAGKNNYYLERAALARREADIPIVLVGGVRSPEDMEKALDSGIDMISMCRPFLCEPDLVTKLMGGQDKPKCVSCSKCFVLAFKYTPGGPKCIQHP
ncbi:MAG: NADH:flavin oxidoreductase [Lachnospiraceae bacterium]|nr:NADH:flavin oxidoreductase [Lachnospiraceae bacterium]